MEKRRSVVAAMISDDNTVGRAIVRPLEKAEAKSKRINLLLKPSLYYAAKSKCESMGISLNETINQLLESWTRDDD